MGKKPRIFPRNCFICGNPMALIKSEEGLTPWLECQGCEVTENGTVNGIFPYNETECEWCGEYVKFIDHSKIYLPSPDMIGTC